MQRGKARDKGNVLSAVNRKEEEAVAGPDDGCRELSGDEKEESHFVLKFQPSIAQQPIRSPPATPIVRCTFHDGVVVSKVL